MNKLIITRWKDKILTALWSNGSVLQLNLEAVQQSILNDIRIGKVKNIVKNINSAFVDLGGGLIGYYSLTENKKHLFTKPHKDNILREGDEIIVQIQKDAVKTKAPVLTSSLNFTGRFSVLTLWKTSIGFSSKIKDEEWKKELRPLLMDVKDHDFGIIIRTNAKEVSSETVLEEIKKLKEEKEKLLRDAAYRTCYSVLSHAYPSYVTSIRDTYAQNLEEIVTDDKTCYDVLKSYLSENQAGDLGKLSLYEDGMISLIKLYSLETVIDKALDKRVWLKSGGYLVIEQTEALVVIDVNSGKYTGKKNIADTILKINLEAALEVGRQLRLRNLCGIIIVDFIDMERQGDQELLMDTLREAVLADPVKTSVVDMTGLGLVELTRKKVRKPLYEQVEGSSIATKENGE